MTAPVPAFEPAGSRESANPEVPPDQSEPARVIELPAPRQADDSLFGVPGIGRATLIGAALGFLAVVLLVGAFVLTTSAPAALLVAAVHAGLFGGVGFGGMLGAVLWSIWHDTDAPEPHAATVTPAPEPAVQADGSCLAPATRSGRGDSGRRGDDASRRSPRRALHPGTATS
jgi:hypothetical protein